MSLVEKIHEDMVSAMKQRSVDRLSTLRMVKSALKNKEIEQRSPVTDAQALQVLTTLIKQRRDSIEQFTNGGRPDLAEKEAAEIVVLEAYLPAAADPSAVEEAVLQAIGETGATSPKDMGRVMKAAMARLAGQTVDGKAVSDLVRRKLTSGPAAE